MIQSQIKIRRNNLYGNSVYGFGDKWCGYRARWGDLFLIESFRANVWWGLACLLLWPVQLVFLTRYWGVAKHPFLIQMIGILCILASAIFAGPEAMLVMWGGSF